MLASFGQAAAIILARPDPCGPPSSGQEQKVLVVQQVARRIGLQKEPRNFQGAGRPQASDVRYVRCEMSCCRHVPPPSFSLKRGSKGRYETLPLRDVLAPYHEVAG
jgi:hypothetical protein